MAGKDEWMAILEALHLAGQVGYGRFCSCEDREVEWKRGICLHCQVEEASKAMTRLLNRMLELEASEGCWLRRYWAGGGPDEGVGVDRQEALNREVIELIARELEAAGESWDGSGVAGP